MVFGEPSLRKRCALGWCSLIDLLLMVLAVALLGVGPLTTYWLLGRIVAGIQEAVARLAPVPVPAPVETDSLPMSEPAPQTPAERPQRILLRLVDEDGGDLGMVGVERGKRPAVFTHRVQGAITNFVASHQANGQWIYRRVGVERE